MQRERARQGVWWPVLSTELEKLVNNCTECCKACIQSPEPLCPSPLPDLPFQKVASDMFELNGRTYLLLVDYYSRYVEIAKLSGTTATEIINHMKGIFARHGIPEVLISDNGSQYASSTFSQLQQTLWVQPLHKQSAVPLRERRSREGCTNSERSTAETRGPIPSPSVTQSHTSILWIQPLGTWNANSGQQCQSLERVSPIEEE